MDSTSILIFLLVVSGLALLTGYYYRSQGYPFWRTALLSLIGYIGIGLLILKLLFS